MKPKPSDAIRIDLGPEVKPGIFEYAVTSLQIEGRSHQPLLDACRKIKPILGETEERIATMYRGDKPSISCKLSIGANLTVSEPSKGSPHFTKYHPFKGL